MSIFGRAWNAATREVPPDDFVSELKEKILKGEVVV